MNSTRFVEGEKCPNGKGPVGLRAFALMLLCVAAMGCAGPAPLTNLVRTLGANPTEADFLSSPVAVGQDEREDAAICASISRSAKLPKTTNAQCMATRRDARRVLTRSANAENARRKEREDAERRVIEQAERERAAEEDEARRIAQQNKEVAAEKERAEAWAAERQRSDAEWNAKRAADAAEEQAAVNAVKKRCGNDYMRVQVGMAWKRVKECAGEFHIKIDDPQFQVYEGVGGLVTVQNGVVRRVVRR